MAQVRGQGTGQAGRNGDGWSNVVSIAPFAILLISCGCGAFPGLTPEVRGSDRWRDKEAGSTTCQGVKQPDSSIFRTFFFFFYCQRSFVCKKCDLF